MTGAESHPHEDHRHTLCPGGIDGLAQYFEKRSVSREAFDYARLDVHDEQGAGVRLADHARRG